MSEAKSVLVVEDEVLIAMDLQHSLQELGWNVVGPVALMDKAMQLVESENIHVGLLDYNIRSGTSAQIARALLDKSIPVIFLSGDTFRERAEEFAQCKVMAKPVSMDELDAALHAALN